MTGNDNLIACRIPSRLQNVLEEVSEEEFNSKSEAIRYAIIQTFDDGGDNNE